MFKSLKVVYLILELKIVYFNPHIIFFLNDRFSSRNDSTCI